MTEVVQSCQIMRRRNGVYIAIVTMEDTVTGKTRVVPGQHIEKCLIFRTDPSSVEVDPVF